MEYPRDTIKCYGNNEFKTETMTNYKGSEYKLKRMLLTADYGMKRSRSVSNGGSLAWASWLTDLSLNLAELLLLYRCASLQRHLNPMG
ncbi:hypothetical protein O3M35_008417 [Rhynocoris fuscipes]|uniref:Uncharacterized protein n=1 Tax=Rhynocoris fuscipes TaxID=488301 RepID=A0AAW1D9P7_9HEMI